MDAVGIFWKPTFYPNHRARNPHPGDGLDPLLGPGIFRALRLLGSILKRFGGALGSILKRFGGALGSILIGIFWKPTFYPNHRARNPHPGDGPDPPSWARDF